MKHIKTNIHEIYVASNLLSLFGGDNIDIQIVDYDYFHLLVTLNKEIPDVRCGVVVIKAGCENTQEFQDYLEEIRKGIFEKDSPDNMPILLMIIDEKEKGYIKILLGMNNRFEQTIYPKIENTPQLNKVTYQKLEPIIQSMNKTITLLSLSSVCVLRTIPFHTIRRNANYINGVFMYARKNTINYQIKAIKYENELDNYLLDPSFEKDELDNLILSSITKKYGHILEIEPIKEKLIALSTDIRDIRLYGRQYGYTRLLYSIRFMPDVTNNIDAIELLGLKNDMELPCVNISIYVKGTTRDLEGNNYYDEIVPLNQFISKCNEVSKLRESFLDIDKWINIQ